ncbi:g10097 [Coccomyxa elongata]
METIKNSDAPTAHVAPSDDPPATPNASQQQNRIAGDGSCLFRAIAQGAHHVSTGSLLGRRQLFEAGFDLRREVCAEMVRRREDIEPFIPGVFDAYVSNMSLEGIWGGEPELAVAIHCIQRPIIVYKEVKSGLLGKDLEKVSEYGADQYPRVSPVCLLFSGFHYDLLMQVVQ